MNDEFYMKHFYASKIDYGTEVVHGLLANQAFPIYSNGTSHRLSSAETTLLFFWGGGCAAPSSSPPPPHFPAGSRSRRLFIGFLVPSWLSPSQLFKQQTVKTPWGLLFKGYYFSAAVSIHAKETLTYGLNKNRCKKNNTRLNFILFKVNLGSNFPNKIFVLVICMDCTTTMWCQYSSKHISFLLKKLAET